MKKCKYCENGEFIFKKFEAMDCYENWIKLALFISKGYLNFVDTVGYVKGDGKYNYLFDSVKVNYCPFCGKELRRDDEDKQ